jgi:hypothetical protein
MTATQGVISAGIALALGVGALVLAQTVWRENAPRLALILVGAILCVVGAVWFLLSLAAYGGDS